MRIYDKKTIKEDILIDVICDICGKKIEKDKFGYFKDYVHVEKLWGYNSNNDGLYTEKDICEECFFKLGK